MLPPDPERLAMCARCIEIDNQIIRFRRLKASINDRQMEEATVKMLTDLELRKVALHPPEK